jgi:ATP-dependent helicase/nuclease subunit A
MIDPSVADVELSDGADRERIAADLASTLFVEAGAGSGKTTALVGRIVRLLAAGGVELAEVAAITFTEAAAAELRQKLYRALRESDSEELRAKASEIDDATITTIHGFAQRLLAEHTIEAGLPLHFEVTDEITATVAFEERFAGFLDDLYDDESAHVLIQALGEFDVRAFHLHAFAEEVDARLGFRDAPVLASELRASDVEGMVVLAADRIEAMIASLCDARSFCTNPDDKLLARLDELAVELERGRALADWTSRLGWLRAIATTGSNLGSRDSWSDVGAIRTLLRDVDGARTEALAAIADVLVRELAERLQAAAIAAAAARVTAGMINFDDLLVLARDLVRDHPGVRSAVIGRFRFILVDEFQDTDPLQTEMLLALSERDGASSSGRLFFVGDPKQSIYSFRGADVGLYATTRGRIVGDQPTRLVTNFRSRPGIVSYVNDLFSRLFVDQSELIGSERAGDLVAARVPHADPAVVLVGGPMERVVAKDRRNADASEIAETIAVALEEQWPVLDGELVRPIRLGDIAILIPTRTSVGAIQSALDRSNIDFTIAETTLVYAADEVRELLGILRAIDDTADERDVIRALRASCFACSDAELAGWRSAGGTWEVSLQPDGPAGHPVGAALFKLARLSAGRQMQRVDATLMMLIDELQIRQGLAARRGRAESLRRLDFIVERARAFVDSTGGTIAQFLDFAEQEASGRARSRELIAASAEVDAVRIMTIHAAKGLEFPLVIVADLGGNVLARTASVLRGDGGLEFSLTAELRSSGFEPARQAQLQLDRAERVRLAYVGMTRARDYLIVMLRHEAARSSQSGLAEQIWSISSELSSWRSGSPPRSPEPPRSTEPPRAPEITSTELDDEEDFGPAPAALGVADLLAWRERRAELLANINQPRSVAPSSLGHGVDELGPHEPDERRAASIVRTDLDAEDDEATPWHRARQASARGRAVHAVLQHASLTDASDLGSLAEVAATDEGIAADAAVVERLAGAALAAPTVRQALRSPQMMRELPLRVGIGEGAIEGIVDLCYLEEDGLVLVDYKTDALGSAADLASAGARYHLQIGAYVLALERATGMAVRRAVLIFLAGSGGALEYEVPDLPGAVEAARRVVAETFRAPLVTRS